MKIESCSLCETGQSRTINQDRVLCRQATASGLFLVADGVGGHFAGEVASGTIERKYREWWEKNACAAVQPAFLLEVEQLQEVLQQTNEEILLGTPTGQRCASTLALLWIQKDKAALLSVGDSRCYLVRHSLLGMRIQQLTHDDICCDAGEQRGKLLEAVGCVQPLHYTLRTFPVTDPAAFILCSDGVYKACAPSLLKRAFCMANGKNTQALEKAAAEIRRLVHDAGEPDN